MEQTLFGEPCDRPDGAYSDNGQSVVVAAGRKYAVPPLEPPDLATVERHYTVSVRKSPLSAEIVKQIEAAPPAIREGLMDRAFKAMRSDTVSPTEVAEYLDTRDGAEFCFWIMLQKQYRGITREQATAIAAAVQTAKLLAIRDEAGKSIVELAAAAKVADNQADDSGLAA